MNLVYVGFHRELNGDYEIEFYIAKKNRRKGYCEEACKAVIKTIFGEGVSVDHNQITVDRLYATNLVCNGTFLWRKNYKGQGACALRNGKRTIKKIWRKCSETVL